MINVTLCKGLPGSGKTTWAKTIVDENPNAYKRVSKDDLRAMLDNSKYSTDAEEFVLKVRDQLILLAIEEGRHVIVDDTNLAPKHEARIRQLVKGKAVVFVKDFTDVDLDVCIDRDLKRCNSVGEKVIRQMYEQFLKPNPEIIAHNPELPFAIICDLDGTLCLLNGRNPYDASTCENDLLNEVVASMVAHYSYGVLLVSGREEKYREQTLAFLSKYNVPYWRLWMRPTGDNRKDCIVKREIFEAQIRGKYNIEFVLDDRNQVVRMWRELGLTCLQVADGNF